LSEDAVLHLPPAPLLATDVLPVNLPEAWTDTPTTALAVAHALSTKVGSPLPWSVVRDAIDGAIRGRLLETTTDSGRWPSDIAGAASVRLAPPSMTPGQQPGEADGHQPRPSGRIAEAELRIDQFQELAESLPALKKAVAGHHVRLVVRVEVGGEKPVAEDVIAKANEVLHAVSEKLGLR